MRVEYSVFAYSAMLTGDGLFSLLGGGIQWVIAKSLPATCRNLCLLVRLSVEPNECDQTHECVVKVTDPDGNTLEPSLVVPVRAVRHRVYPDKPSAFTAHYAYDGFTFTKAGVYRFRIAIGDKSLGEAILDVGEELQP